MRHALSESPVIIQSFGPGDSVTIDIYNLADDSKIVDAAACSEVGATGIFKYVVSIAVASFSQYLWIMTNGADTAYGTFDIGGCPDENPGDVETVDGSVGAVKLKTDNLPADTGSDLAEIAAMQDNVPSGSGAGVRRWTYELKHGLTHEPIPDAEIWVTSQPDQTGLRASGRTDQYGKVTFWLDPGTVYVWRSKSGYNFINPDTENVTA